MMTDLEKWDADGKKYGWRMPYAPFWKRLPVIRHVRCLWASVQVDRWYSSGPGAIGIRTGYDEWVLFGIWHGKDKAND